MVPPLLPTTGKQVTRGSTAKEGPGGDGDLGRRSVEARAGRSDLRGFPGPAEVEDRESVPVVGTDDGEETPVR